MQILSGKRERALKAVLYGPEGIGKSTFAAQFPEPLFIDTEGSTKFMDVRRFKPPQSWTELLAQVQYVRDMPGVCKTLVVDTADWAERLCIQHICAKYQKNGLEGFDYGRGYMYAYETFGELLNLLNAVIDKNIHVVLTAHAAMNRCEQPEEFGSYDRWELKLINSQKCSTSKMVKEWCDLLLFANYKTIVVADGKTNKNKAQGGKRVMYTTHHPCWDAKNRFSMLDELPFLFDAVSPYLFDAPATPAAAPDPPPMPDPPAAEGPDVPAVLRPLLEKDDILEGAVRDVIARKGYYTADTPWRVMLESGFVDGWVVPFWDKIVDMIRADRNELPF